MENNSILLLDLSAHAINWICFGSSDTDSDSTQIYTFTHSPWQHPSWKRRTDHVSPMSVHWTRVTSSREFEITKYPRGCIRMPENSYNSDSNTRNSQHDPRPFKHNLPFHTPTRATHSSRKTHDTRAVYHMKAVDGVQGSQDGLGEECGNLKPLCDTVDFLVH